MITTSKMEEQAASGISRRWRKKVYTPSFVIFDNLSPPVSLKMFEEDQNVETASRWPYLPNAKDKLTDDFIVSTLGLDRATLVSKLYCRSLHIVPSVNLFRVFYKIGKQGDWFTFERRVGPGSGGKILNETFSGLKGWKKRFFFLDRRAIPQAMAWRHHDSDIHDPLPTDGFHASDVVTLTNQSIDIRPVPSGLLFHAGLATTWEFSGFLPVFKDTEGNVVTMSEYLRFPFLDGATIEQGDALSARDAITQRTTGPLPVNQSLPEKTARLKEVEIPDPKIVAIRERKARAAAKKRAERKRAAGGEGGSKGKPKRRKVSAVRAEEEDSTEEASSASPLRTVAPNPSFLLKDVGDAGTAESRENEHVSVPHHDSANTSIHNYAADHDESFDESGGHGETIETHPADETRLTETPVPARNPEKTAVQDLVPVEIMLMGADVLHVCLLFTFLNGPSIEGPEWTLLRNAGNWHAQTDALLRFEALYDAHLALKERCEDVTRQLELEAELARKDSALVFSDRVSNERAVENERLVSKLGCLEKEKTDSIGKLLPTVVMRLLNSHEYKESLSIPFNLAIHGRCGQGLTCESWSEEDLMDVLREVQGFDPHSDTRMTVEYDKLFTKTYPFVEKISGLPRRTVQELLKMYPAPPPQDALRTKI
ncbi:hypothetical protein Tco_0852903 [Tanacetum coccineum]